MKKYTIIFKLKYPIYQTRPKNQKRALRICTGKKVTYEKDIDPLQGHVPNVLKMCNGECPAACSI